MEDMKLLHIGCADRYIEGFINSDSRTEWKGRPHKLDLVMDIAKPWPYEDNSVDGIVSMHVFQQLPWRDLVFALREAYRVLRRGGTMRFGVPTIENGRGLDYLLGWLNVNLFSGELLEKVCKEVGFKYFTSTYYQVSSVPEFLQVDNRPEQTFYFEVIK